MEKQLLESLLGMNHLNLKTKLFLSDISAKADKFGSFTESQKTVVKKIANENGLKFTEKIDVPKHSGPIMWKKDKCITCNDHGSVIATKDDLNYGFACSCFEGSKFSGLGKWNSNREKEGFVL